MAAATGIDAGQPEPRWAEDRLVEGLRRKEPWAYQDFVCRFGPIIMAWLRRKSLDHEDAEDVRQ